MININEIKVNSDNPRTIEDDRFKRLIESVKDFPKMMELRPIVVDQDGVILGGNMRFMAIEHLGYTEIPDTWVKFANNLTEEEARRFIVEDNVLFGEWNFEILAKEWDSEDLMTWGVDLEIDVNDKNHEFDYEDQCIMSDNVGTTKNMKRVNVLGFNIVLTDEEAEILKKSIERYININGITSGYFFHILKEEKECL